jgi:hypothetical protein
MQLAFIIGALTSIVSGYIGMSIAVYANGRVASSARAGIGAAFQTAFKAGTVMGFALVSLGVLMLYITISLFLLNYDRNNADATIRVDAAQRMYEAISGMGCPDDVRCVLVLCTCRVLTVPSFLCREFHFNSLTSLCPSWFVETRLWFGWLIGRLVCPCWWWYLHQGRRRRR